MAYPSEALTGDNHDKNNMRKIHPCDEIDVPSASGTLINPIVLTISPLPTNKAIAFTPNTRNGHAQRR